MEPTNDTTVSVHSDEPRRGTLFERTALYILSGSLLLLPVFFIPALWSPLQFNKVLLVIAGVFIAAMLLFAAQIRKGNLSFQSSPLLATVWLLPVAYLLSALFSTTPFWVSFLGRSIEVDTVFFVGAGALLVTITPFLVRTKNQILAVYSGLLIGFCIVAVFQLVRLWAGVDVLSFDIFTTSTGNLIGKWNDLGIFFGLTAILSLITLEALRLPTLSQMVLYATLAVSLFFLAVINFSFVWIVLGIFALGFSIYSIRKWGSTSGLFQTSAYANEQQKPILTGVSVASFLVLLIAIVFFVGGDAISERLSSFFEISTLEARPAWQTTVSILKDVYEESALLGASPNTWSLVWAEHKPVEVNNSVFWNTDFAFGVGYIPTSFATTGLLGGIAWVVFLGLFLWNGIRTLLLRAASDPFVYYLSLSSFAAALFLWIFAVVYIPNTVILSLAFFFTGLYLASLTHQGDAAPRERRFAFSDNPRLGFMLVVALTLFSIVLAIGLYTAGARYLAATYFGRGVVALNREGDREAAKASIEKARSLVDTDSYARASVELELQEINEILNVAEGTPEERLEVLRGALSRAIEHGQRARDLNPQNYQNWFMLGRVYQSVVPLQIEGAYENARESYERALEFAPNHPAIYLAQAELEVLNGNPEDAKRYINEALERKQNYTAAVFLLAQIQVNQNELTEAIRSVEAATLLEPNNPVIFFQLGLLHYNLEDYAAATDAFEEAVVLNTIYANARYFLGLSYYYLDRASDAILQFERVAETNPDNEEVQLSLENLRAGRAPFAGSEEFNEPENREEPPIEE
jgi:tetratricopeptide (TPR) repeat protein